jgi:hypothetical protein
MVWLPDPTLQYFSGKHAPLALVAIAFGLLILAFTAVLLCVRPLQRYSHLRCFSWMAKLKPLIDAYTAPHVIKDNCRYWEGLLLLFRLVLASIFSVNEFNNSRLDKNLYPIALLCAALLIISWSIGGVYKKLHLNILNLTSIANLCIMVCSLTLFNKSGIKYIYQSKSFAKVNSFRIISYTSFSIEVLVLAFVLSCYTYRCVHLCRLKYRHFKYGENSSEHLPVLRQLAPHN